MIRRPRLYVVRWLWSCDIVYKSLRLRWLTEGRKMLFLVEKKVDSNALRFRIVSVACDFSRSSIALFCMVQSHASLGCLALTGIVSSRIIMFIALYWIVCCIVLSCTILGCFVFYWVAWYRLRWITMYCSAYYCTALYTILLYVAAFSCNKVHCIKLFVCKMDAGYIVHFDWFAEFLLLRPLRTSWIRKPSW